MCAGCRCAWFGNYFNKSFCNDCIKELPDHDCGLNEGQACQAHDAWYAAREWMTAPEVDERPKDPMPSDEEINAMAEHLRK